jgi:DNA-binding NtrC family response regulator
MGGGGRLGKHNLPREILNFESKEIPAQRKLPETGIDLNQLIIDLENSLIQQALERCHYNKNHAAKLLGLNRTTLVERIKKRGLGL